MHANTPRPLPRNYPLSSTNRRALREAIKRDAFWTISPHFDGATIARMTRSDLIDTARTLGIDARAIVERDARD